jgi:hypoxanthine phosphoribosyltransferase
VAELAAAIDADYAGRDPLIIFIMKGALVFVADLIRAMKSDFRIDFMVLSSYGERTSTSGSVRIVADLKADVRGRDVLLVEDIIDSGLTLAEVIEHLLSKPSRRRVPIEARYVGFEIEDRFVVGYGLDFGERYRGLPYVAEFEPDAVEIAETEGG